jgi:hypothetical protein
VTTDCNRENARRVAVRVLACALVAVITGCGINCDRSPDEPPVEYRGGVTENGTYRSAKDGLRGPFLQFSPGRTYRLFHDLGGIPAVVDTRLAFSEGCGNQERGVERSAEAAGNQVSLEQPTSPEYIDLRNDSCSDVCLYVTASGPILQSEPPAEVPDAGDTPPTPSDGG